MGTIDGDPGIAPHAHIFVESKAAWFEISDSLPQKLEPFARVGLGYLMNPSGFEKPGG